MSHFEYQALHQHVSDNQPSLRYQRFTVSRHRTVRADLLPPLAHLSLVIPCSEAQSCAHKSMPTILNRIQCSISENYGPGSSVGIATDYGLEGPESNPGGDEIFRPSRPALGAHPALL